MKLILQVLVSSSIRWKRGGSPSVTGAMCHDMISESMCSRCRNKFRDRCDVRQFPSMEASFAVDKA